MEKPWSHQNKLKQQPIPDQQQLLIQINTVPNQRDKALCAFAYLTGGRISEIIKEVQKKHLEDGWLDGKKVLLIDMPNRKNKKRHRKKIPILVDREKDFINIIEEYINTLQLEDVLFNFNKHRAYQIIRKHLDMNCHFLRDIRLTHLVTKHDLNGHQVKLYAGWSDTRPADTYIQLNWRNIWK